MADITITLTPAQAAKLDAAVALDNAARGRDWTAQDYLNETVSVLVDRYQSEIIKNAALTATMGILSVQDAGFNEQARKAIGDAASDILIDYAQSLQQPPE